tara:strand:- start:627 stop:962 length:336 start_codon:yes stop_codon:yes gene_type:complete
MMSRRLVSDPAVISSPKPTLPGSRRRSLLPALACLFPEFGTGRVDAQTNTVPEQAEQYQRRALACGADIGCIQHCAACARAVPAVISFGNYVRRSERRTTGARREKFRNFP